MASFFTNAYYGTFLYAHILAVFYKCVLCGTFFINAHYDGFLNAKNEKIFHVF